MTTYTPEAIEAALDDWHNGPGWRATGNPDDFRRYMSRALAAADAAMEAAGFVRVPVEPWRPIEMAPKDGTHIIVANANNPNIPPTTVHWFEGAWSLSVNQKAEDSDYVWGPPTHWRPLPAMIAARPTTPQDKA